MNSQHYAFQSARRLIREGTILLFFFAALTAGVASPAILVKDINPGYDPSIGSGMLWIRPVGLEGYFTARSYSSGNELWRTDGTFSGTRLVKDIFPGPQGSFPSLPTDVNGTAFFSAYPQDGKAGLWKSDGTDAGTVFLKNLSNIYGITNLNGTAYFVAHDEVHGSELWKSDGSDAGTVLVKDIIPGITSSVPNRLYAAGDTLFFTVDNGTQGNELWKTDGTEAGTVIIKDINASGSASPDNQLVVGDRLYFTANDGSGIDVWKTDGTTVGTVKVKQLSSANVVGMTRLNDTSFTFISGVGTGAGLWVSDGTSVGTSLIKNIQLATAYYAVANEVLYFSSSASGIGAELWRSDGTVAGTYLVKDINPSGSSSPSYLTTVGSNVYFAARTAASGVELWKTDGTDAGTVLVKDINPFSTGFPAPTIGSSSPSRLKNINGMLLFSADDGINGLELWKSDGTADGTALVRNIASLTNSSNPADLTDADGNLYFSVSQNGNTDEIWLTDGTESGTVALPYRNQNSSQAKQFFPVGNTVYFFSRSGALYSTVTGSKTFEHVHYSGDEESHFAISNFLQLKENIYFTAVSESASHNLWRIAPGSSMAEKVFSAPGSNGIPRVNKVNDMLYIFTANHTNYTTTLWKSDGTTTGTIFVGQLDGLIYEEDDLTGSRDSVLNNSLLFTLSTYSGDELWITDGASSGTVRVTNANEASVPHDFRELVEMNGSVYFSATCDDDRELWTTDGTPAGTREVRNLNIIESSEPNFITKMNGRIYFSANDGVNGVELWATDGTGAGTIMLRDIFPGGSSSPQNLSAVDGRLYFSANDGVHGQEPWVSDGSVNGTTLLQDLSPGSLFSSPDSFCGSGSYIYFSADQQNEFGSGAGRELWALPLENPNSAVDVWQLYE